MPITLVPGQNTRNVALTPLPPATIIDIPVIAGSDDAYQQADGVMNLTSSLLIRSWPGVTPWERTSVGLRFQNVTIPGGAIIVASYISIYPPSDTLDNDVNARLYLENSGNALDFVVNPTILNRPRTITRVTWIQDDLPVGAYLNSPSLNGPLQEMLNRADWAAGNSLAVLIIANEDIAKTIRFWPQENYRNLPARLHIEYI